MRGREHVKPTHNPIPTPAAPQARAARDEGDIPEPDAIVVVDNEGHILRVNAQAEAMFGYRRGELLGQPVEVLIPERFRDQISCSASPTAPRTRAMGSGLPLFGRRKDGSEFAADIMLSPVQMEGVSAVIAVVRDITERQQAEDTARRQRDELAARARIIGATLRTRDFGERLDIILREAMNFLGVEMGCVHVVMGDEVVLRCWGGISDELRAHLLSFPADNLPLWMREPCVVHEPLSEQGEIPDFAKREGIQAVASVPLTLTPVDGGEGRWLGTLMLASRRLYALNEEEVGALQAMAEQLALAIDHARHTREAERRLARLTVLRAIDRAIIVHQPIHSILHAVLERVPTELGAEAIAVSLLDEEQPRTRVFVMRLPNGTVIEEEAFTLADSLLHWFVDRKESVIIHDLTQDPRVQMHRERIRHHRLISYLGVPLVALDKTIGILHLLTTTPKTFADEDVDFFRTMAGQAAIAIENSRMFEEATQRAQALARMVANMVSSAGVTPEQAPALLLRAFQEVTRCDHVGYFRFDETTQTLTRTEAIGCPCPPERGEGTRAEPPIRLDDERSFVSQVARTRKPFYLSDCHADPRWQRVNPAIRSAYFVPLVFGERLFGVVVLLENELNAFSSLQRSLTDTFATYAAAAMEAARLLQQTRMAEQKYRSIFENVTEGLFQSTPDGRFITANPALARMLGYDSPEELIAAVTDIGQQLYVQPELREEFKRRLAEHGVIRGLEGQAYRKDGSKIWLEENVYAVHDQSGRVCYEGTLKDITERKQAEEALQARARQQAAVAQLGQCALTAVDLPTLMNEAVNLVAQTLEVELTKILELSPEGDTLLLRAGVGWKEGLVGQATVSAGTDSQAGYTLLSSEPIIVEDLRTETRFSGPPLLREHNVVSCISVIIGSKERPFGVLGAHTPQRRTFTPSEIDFLQAVANMLAEAIERKRVEESLRQQFTRISLLNQITRAIAERHDPHSIFRATLQRLEDYLPMDYGGIYLYDPLTDTLTVAARGPKSQPLAAELGTPEGTVIPLEDTAMRACIRGEVVYVPDRAREDTAISRKLVRAGLRSGVNVPLMIDERVIGVLAAVRRDVDGFSSAECEFLRVLSEHVALAAHQAQLRLELQRAYDDLRQTQEAVMRQERLRALGQMASGIAHDINNALAPIVGYAELLLMNPEENLSDCARRYVETIKTAGADIAHIVARMREFYRQRAAQEELFPLDLNRLVRQVIDMTRPRWKDVPQQRGITIDVVTDLQDDLPALLGIESEIREALTNLIFNAVDALPDGGTITIKTRDERLGMRDEKESSLISHPSSVILSVSDTGVGMTEETRQRCLEPFFSTKGERGTGLGLAMVYGTMQRYEGDIQIESVLGRGTTMQLIFPVRELVAVDVPDVVATSVVPPLRLLFIDDEPLLRQLMKEMLEADGHAVEVADSGQTGLDAFRAARERGEAFDLVITDLGMPLISRRKVARTVKRESPSTPVVLLTGWGTRLGSEGDIPAEVDAVLSKPPRLAELRDALRRVMKR